METIVFNRTHPELVHITPEIAKEWLANKKQNRRISEAQVKGMVADIKNHNWKLNGETIVLDSDNQLVDGQHRLTAVVQAGEPIDSWVIFNISSDQAEIYDRGRNRSTTDTLTIKGLEKWKTDPMIANIIRQHYDVQFSERKISDNTIAEFVNTYPEDLKFIYDSIQIGRRDRGCMAKKKGIMYACFAALQCGVSRESVRRFIEVVNSGEIRSEPERTIIRFRDNIVTSGSTGRGAGNDLLKKAETALFFVTNGKRPKFSFKDLDSVGMDNYYTRNNCLKSIRV